ncbi:L1Tc protein [Trypanosoma rangeli]|uniref:L1Tc protein n=1 Tax=Trypanosoma rangeli TaxID=5698 RepID=A0A3R7JST5_TRYRA|nr:L1Tc protein [Trypanosoma rangeli]RNE96273.1 L1Tc protein [Trypanosoma rangeli]|eukprot:RNE96273.1 L1Tc protein [Trypanosoma rangeli]
MDCSIAGEKKLKMKKLRTSKADLAQHTHRAWTLATDGGVDAYLPAGARIPISSLHRPGVIENVRVHRGIRPHNYRTESCTLLLLALNKLIVLCTQHGNKTPCVVTYSQSLLAARNKGPPSQTDSTKDQIWQCLSTLRRVGRSVHLQFCYGHRGIPANGTANECATPNATTALHTEKRIASPRHTDLLACLTAKLAKAWRATTPQDTHRRMLCFAASFGFSGDGPIAQEDLV